MLKRAILASIARPSTENVRGQDIPDALSLIIDNSDVSLTPDGTFDVQYAACVCNRLQGLLMDDKPVVREAATAVFKLLVVMAPQGMAELLRCCLPNGKQKDLFHGGFELLLRKDSDELTLTQTAKYKSNPNPEPNPDPDPNPNPNPSARTLTLTLTLTLTTS